MTPEFNLIQKFFTPKQTQADLGIGDDAALIRVTEGHQLAISVDMLVAGTHFLHDCSPYLIGWKSLAVNISDMAAMGAQPKWATLSLALPEINEAWLAEFSRGFFACADAYKVDLIGGDTTRGPLTVNVTIMGETPHGKALKRSGADVGDEIWVSGPLGEAALALAGMQGRVKLTEKELDTCRQALEQPQPRVALGLKLRDIATSAIDISDGLLADLGHILETSGVGADIHLNLIPRSEIVGHHLHENQMQVENPGRAKNQVRIKNQVQTMILAGGDDYELCFTAPANRHDEISSLGELLALPMACIGTITSGRNLLVRDANEEILNINETGFDHFA
ncbi:MAG: thiamine-phosphate kinase [Candidatus Methylopumilus sp.]